MNIDNNMPWQSLDNEQRLKSINNADRAERDLLHQVLEIWDGPESEKLFYRFALDMKEEVDAIKEDLKEKKEEVDAIKEDLKEMEEEVDAIKEDLNAMKEFNRKRSLSIYKDGWLQLVDHTVSGAHVDKAHVPVDRIETEIFFEQLKIGEEMWEKPVFVRPPENATWKAIDSEQDVVSHVKDILIAVIDGLELNGKIKVITNRFVAGTEIDILLVYGETKIPFAAVEVKKPHNKKSNEEVFAEKKSHIAGQNLDQLQSVQLMGFKRVFGMITTGNDFMLTCTEQFSSDSVSTTANERNAVSTADENDAAFSPFKKTPFGTEQAPIIQLSAKQLSAKVKRLLLYTSQLITPTQTNGHIMIQVMQAFICLAYQEMKRLIESTDDEHKPLVGVLPARLLNLNSNANSHAFTKLTLSKAAVGDSYISMGTTNIYLVRHLGFGANGDCCLAISKDGQTCCAVKFFQARNQSVEFATLECNLWNAVYGWEIKCRVGQTSETCGFLVMPYLRPPTDLERTELLRNNGKLIRDALRKFSSGADGNFYMQKDIKWRHLGYYKKELCVLDFGDVVQIKQDKVNEWITNAIAMLRAKNGKDERPAKKAKPSQPQVAEQVF
jgi:Family of unknown function (DUF5898)